MSNRLRSYDVLLIVAYRLLHPPPSRLNPPNFSLPVVLVISLLFFFSRCTYSESCNGIFSTSFGSMIRETKNERNAN